MGPTTPFDVTVESRDGITTLALNGELDMATAPVLAEWLRTAEQDGCAVTMLDLRNLTFVDACGLRAFIQAWNRAGSNGLRLLFFGATGATRRLFEMTGTDHMLDEGEADSAFERFVHSPAGTSRSTESAVG